MASSIWPDASSLTFWSPVYRSVKEPLGQPIWKRLVVIVTFFFCSNHSLGCPFVNRLTGLEAPAARDATRPGCRWRLTRAVRQTDVFRTRP